MPTIDGQWKLGCHEATPSFLVASWNIGRSWRKVVAFHWPVTPTRPPAAFLPYRIPPTAHRSPDHVILGVCTGVRDSREAGMLARSWCRREVTWCGDCEMLALLLLMSQNRFSRRQFRIKSTSWPAGFVSYLSPSVTESVSLPLSIILWPSYTDGYRVTCDATSHLIASLHTSRL